MMKALPKVSIIIPIYNSEKYLITCLNSIKKQTFNEFEVILINDGSTDKSLNICKEFCDADDRFSLINKENTGVSDCRNIGIKFAKADYIMFVDGDDWIEEKTVEIGYYNMKESRADMCQFNFYFANDEKDYILGKHFNTKKQIFEKDDINILKQTILSPEFTEKCLNKKIGRIKACWGKIYSRKLLEENKIEFNKNLKIHEDTVFNLEVLQKSKKILFLDEYLYYYRKNETSITNRYCPNKIQENQLVIEEINKLLKEEEPTVQAAKDYLFFELFCNYIIKDVYNYENKKDYKTKKKEIKENLNRYKYNQVMKTINTKYLNTKHKLVYNLIRLNLYKMLYLLVKLKEG